MKEMQGKSISYTLSKITGVNEDEITETLAHCWWDRKIAGYYECPCNVTMTQVGYSWLKHPSQMLQIHDHQGPSQHCL